jgi:hypothetical protein
MKRFAELVGHHTGAAIVIGGGPTAPSDFAAAIAVHPDALHISANHHGFLLPGANCKWAVHIDQFHQHLQRHMKDVLQEYGKPFGAKMIGRYEWDDYKLIDWRYGGDTGVMALIVAQMFGAAPVIPCGFGRWLDAAKPGSESDFYFHGTPGKKWPGPPTAPGLQRLVPAVGLKAIRAVSGPMLTHFPKLGVPAERDISAFGEFQQCQTSDKVTRFAPVMSTDHRRYRPKVPLKRMF